MLSDSSPFVFDDAICSMATFAPKSALVQPTDNRGAALKPTVCMLASCSMLALGARMWCLLLHNDGRGLVCCRVFGRIGALHIHAACAVCAGSVDVVLILDDVPA